MTGAAGDTSTRSGRQGTTVRRRPWIADFDPPCRHLLRAAPGPAGRWPWIFGRCEGPV